ncbi:SapB/AmfS family lantipeptide [Streptomyces sp. NRRL B-1677]|nr:MULTISPECIES: SapB/AmfS family lanthipeptide [Streptomyces]MBF6046505.1 SapB/AmfS family lantipeptide [Streptomyces sp. NRRL B-1677]
MVLLDMQLMESATAARQGPGFGAGTGPNSDLSLLLCHEGDQ